MDNSFRLSGCENNAAMNTGVYGFAWRRVVNLLGHIPRGRMAGSHDNVICNFVKLHLFLHI